MVRGLFSFFLCFVCNLWLFSFYCPFSPGLPRRGWQGGVGKAGLSRRGWQSGVGKAVVGKAGLAREGWQGEVGKGGLTRGGGEVGGWRWEVRNCLQGAICQPICQPKDCRHTEGFPKPKKQQNTERKNIDEPGSKRLLAKGWQNVGNKLAIKRYIKGFFDHCQRLATCWQNVDKQLV